VVIGRRRTNRISGISCAGAVRTSDSLRYTTAGVGACGVSACGVSTCGVGACGVSACGAGSSSGGMVLVEVESILNFVDCARHGEGWYLGIVLMKFCS